MKMNKKLRFLNWKTMLILLGIGWASISQAQNYIYFDLAAGEVTINASSYSGQIFTTTNGVTTTQTVSGTHSASNQYYVYQSQDTYPSATGSYRTTTGLVNGTMIIPSYDRVEDWANYTKDNTDVNGVIVEWRTRAAAAFRTATQKKIVVSCSNNMNVDLTIQDLWSNQQAGGATTVSGGLRVICSNTTSIRNAHVNLHYLGDNRFGNIYYLAGKGAGNQFVFDSPDATHSGTLTVANIQENANTNYWRAVIGADDSNGNSDGLVFNNGYVFAGATPQDNCTAIGAGGNDFGGITINGGTITAVASTTGTAIGGGIGWSSNGGDAYVHITDGEVYAYNFGISELSPNQYTSCVPVAAIGGGSSQSSSGNNSTEIVIEGGTVYAYSAAGAAIGGGSTSTQYGGKATITIGKSNGEGPTITAISTASTYYSYSAPAGVSIGGGTGGVGGSNTNGGNVTLNVLGGVINAYSREMENGQPGPLEFGHIGGGKTNGSGNGGSATIKVYDGTLTCGTIGGGDAITGNGGYASVIVTGGSIYEAAIGGGDSQSGRGGDANITVSGGLFDGGSIGGGDSESGFGGNASIYITGGTLDCGSIGGGDSSTGTPGSVTANVDPNANPLGAGIYIAGDNPIIVKSGYIGGGTNDAGDIGKATAYINTSHDDSSIQGQFILCNNTSTSTDHCFFVMEGGTIDNTDLEGLDGEDYPRAKEEGGAVYMEDENGVVSISGNSIIRKSNGTKGGAVYMTNGSFTLDGGVIHDNTASEQGGAVYLGGGSLTLTSGAIGTEGHPNTADELGGGVYLSGSGAFNMSGGALSYNVGFAGGGGAYVNGGTVNITGGTVSYNSTDDDCGNGGGVFANGGSVSIESSTIEYNTAGTNGGGVYAGGGSVTLTSSTITYNTATNDDGGGVCAAGGTLILDGGEVANNTAGTNGGGFFVNPGTSNTTTIRNHAYIHDNSATNGGGAYVKSGQLVVKTAAGSKDDPTRINDNRASANGGGVYVENGDVTLTSVTMDGNEAGTSGGAMYTGGGSVTLTSSTVANNTATNGNGGGIYAIGAVTAEASSSITGNHADNGNGGGIYADAGENTVSVKGTSSITGNAAKNGAGIYAASGDIQVLTGSTMSGNTATADGGGIYANGGTVTVNPGNASTVAMTDNHADSGNGGAIYANGGTVDFSNGTISANTASNGGAIYANGGLVDFSDGTIGNNYASVRGGGLYITTNGTLELKGTATLTGNHVPSAGQGGGVYLAGVVKVGSEGGSSSNPKADAVIAEDNYADDVENPTITPDNRNNVYLPQPRVNGNAGSNDGHKDVITIYPYGMALEAGSKTAATHVGFSVPRNYVPVIFCTDDAYLGNNKPALEATVFDDSEQYLTIWNGSAPYDAHYIYLSGLLWTEAVDEEPATGFSIDGDGNVTVTNENGLAWLITYVNGRGGNHPMSPQDMEGKTVTIDMEGDLDMGRCGWVAIGTDGNKFKGTFNGNGHTISNIIATFGDDPGLFGTVSSGAQIKDVFVKGATLSCTKSDGGTYYMGTLASTLAGDAVVSGCGADGLMDCIENATGTVMGGLVGRMAAEGGQYPTIHSCFATPSMEGYTMGGIVGRMDGGSIANSFTHPKFTYSGPYLVDPEDPATAQDCYIGGLVAEMGTINTQSDVVEIGGNSNVASNGQYLPLYISVPASPYSLTQQIYTSDEMGTAGSITQIQLYVTNPRTDAKTVDIYLSNTNISKFDKDDVLNTYQTHTESTQNLVFSGTMTPQPATSWITIELDTPFEYDGESNVLMTFYDRTGIGGQGYQPTFGTYPTSTTRAIYSNNGSAQNINETYSSYTSNYNNRIRFNKITTAQEGICSIENCYVHEQADSDRGTGLFGWFAGKYTDGTFAYCYAPEDGDYIHPTSTGTLGNTGYGWFAPTALQSGKYGFKHQDQDVTAADGQDNDYIKNGVIEAVTDGVVNNNGDLKGLLATLNNWVKAHSSAGYALWTRTMASSINGDYPVLRYEGYDCVGSEDGASIVYKRDVNDMLEDFLEGDIYLYRTPDVISKNTSAGVRVYIKPNVGILQAAGNILNARVGVTFDNSDGGWLGGKPYDWHMFATPLRDAPLGLVYHSQETGYEGVSDYTVGNNYSSGANYILNGIPESVYSDRVNMDPPKTTWNTEEGSVGYFPTDTPYGTWRNQPATGGSFDFYCYDESSRHWINFKREGREDFYDHWSDYVYNPSTDTHTNIPYKNETVLEPGKGYMMAVSEPTMLMADGVLNNGDADGTVRRTATYREGNGYDYSLRGVNLVGNPFQSYLDADLFLGENGLDTYYILDADKQGYIARVRGGSTLEPAEEDVVDYTAPQYVHPHQAFFVKVSGEQELRYTSDMRKTSGGSFRSEGNHYPMVTMACSDEDGRNDFATIELDRPDQGGGEKVKGLHAGDASLWFSMEDTEWQVAFAPVGTTTASLRFQAYEDGVFTLGWHTANADFNYLHLIDNLTGVDVDCLKADEYRFEGKTTDYHSRFKLVFGYIGVDENEDDDPSADMASFVFQMGDGLVVNGEGKLQMFDVNGRLLMSSEVYGTQTVVGLPEVSAGVYILRLTANKRVRVQKMVINK